MLPRRGADAAELQLSRPDAAAAPSPARLARHGTCRAERPRATDRERELQPGVVLYLASLPTGARGDGPASATPNSRVSACGGCLIRTVHPSAARAAAVVPLLAELDVASRPASAGEIGLLPLVTTDGDAGGPRPAQLDIAGLARRIASRRRLGAGPARSWTRPRRRAAGERRPQDGADALDARWSRRGRPHEDLVEGHAARPRDGEGDHLGDVLGRDREVAHVVLRRPPWSPRG